jgi:hypothetical protein
MVLGRDQEGPTFLLAKAMALQRGLTEQIL